MFTISFAVLLALTLASLAIIVVRQGQVALKREEPITVSGLVLFGLCLTLATVLATGSEFQYAVACWAFMAISLFADFGYHARLVQKKVSGERLPKPRFWWPVVDNTAWVVVLCLLYFA